MMAGDDDVPAKRRSVRALDSDDGDDPPKRPRGAFAVSMGSPS